MDHDASAPAPRDEPVDLGKVPRAPRQPSKLARELIYAYRGGQKVLLIIGVVFSLIGLPIAGVFCWGVPVDLAIAFAGREVAAAATGTELQTNVRINDRHPTRITFRYEVDGVAYDGASSTLDGALIRAAELGEALVVEVADADPTWARIEGTSYALFGMFGLFTLIFPLVGVAMTFFAVRSNRREIRAFTRGTAVVARVTHAGFDTSTRINNRHPFMVEWEFEAEDGRTYRGSLSHMEPEALAFLAERREIPVLYDRIDPKINTAYVP